MVNPAMADFHILTWRWKFCRGPGGRIVGFAACNTPPARPWCNEHPASHQRFDLCRKEFVLLIVVSIVLPLALYAVMMLKKALSRAAALLYGITLVVISGANVVLLQRLASMAKISLATLDNQVLSSEISLALYLLPALFAGIGINIISHVIVSHLGDASASSHASRRKRVRSMPANLRRNSVQRSPGPASYPSVRQRKPLIRSATILRLSSVASSGAALHSVAMARSSSSAP